MRDGRLRATWNVNDTVIRMEVARFNDADGQLRILSKPSKSI